MQCTSCGCDCGHTKKTGCQYRGNAQHINTPTDAAIKEGIKHFKARYSESDPLNDWRAFYMEVARLTPNAF